MKSIYDNRYRAVILQLRARRVALGLDQRTVATRLGYTNRWLSKVERMDIRLDIRQFACLCRALRLDAGQLIRRLAEEESEEAPPLLPLTLTGCDAYWSRFFVIPIRAPLGHNRGRCSEPFVHV